MKDKIFVDNNIWLYAFMEEESTKTEIARKIINTNTEVYL